MTARNYEVARVVDGAMEARATPEGRDYARKVCFPGIDSSQ